MITIDQVRPDQIEELRVLLREYIDWAIQLGAGTEAPAFKDVYEEIVDLPGIYVPPRARMLVADVDGKISGSIALKQVSESVGEVKRFFVRPDCRGKGVGGQLVTRMLEDAKSIGYQKLILDSHASMVDAHNAYRKVGFVDVPPSEGFPEWLAPQVVFMEMSL